jgi:probable rRNA maturation factor
MHSTPSELNVIPSDQLFKQWSQTALKNFKNNAAKNNITILIRIVDEAESAHLNQQYRHKQGPTNVLSFPSNVPDFIDDPSLGDIIICAPIVNKEANQQHKNVINHWAHMVIHGILHCLGYDHLDDDSANKMETLEINILNQLGMTNPYVETSL